jgi:hypothetical protein
MQNCVLEIIEAEGERALEHGPIDGCHLEEPE